ncbi:hypothetical protein HK100_012824 [Physocladia obscura]|uniref:GATA-type domain-containing protein n=1 Tax=Physocladia obscura TaxID=109957 RepID=A0AAD5T085_9FUNG|nr:hypothetical protein HK100_012824 [Physocladia obscura]
MQTIFSGEVVDEMNFAFPLQSANIDTSFLAQLEGENLSSIFDQNSNLEAPNSCTDTQNQLCKETIDANIFEHAQTQPALASFSQTIESLSNCFENVDSYSHQQKPRKKQKKPKSAFTTDAVKPGDQWKCIQCGAGEADTPLKRKGPDKKRNYCNACYVRWRVKVERSERGSARPVFATSSVFPINAIRNPSVIIAQKQSGESNLNSFSNVIPSTTNEDFLNLHRFRFSDGLLANTASQEGTIATLKSPKQHLDSSNFTSPFVSAGSAKITLNQSANENSINIQNFNSPYYPNYEWNNITRCATDKFGQDRMLDFTPSPLDPFDGIQNQSFLQWSLGLSSQDSIFENQKALLTAAAAVASNHHASTLGVPLDMMSWAEQTINYNAMSLQNSPSQKNQSMLQFQSGNSFLEPPAASYLPCMGATGDMTEISGQFNKTCTILGGIDNGNKSTKGDDNDNVIGTYAAADPTYFPVFDGSTTEIDYNQLLGYGADVSFDAALEYEGKIDASSTHEFLHGTGFSVAGEEYHHNHGYHYEPVSQFLLREGYDFESSML